MVQCLHYRGVYRKQIREDFMKTFQKTNHFKQRSKQKRYNQKIIERLMSNVAPITKNCIFVFSKEQIKSAGKKINKYSHLIIIMKRNRLITLFEVPDLSNFVKWNSIKYKNCSLIFI